METRDGVPGKPPDTLERNTQRAIRDASPLSEKTFQQAWATLVSDKTVVPDGTIRKGNGQQYDAWRLSDGGD